jgi:hypothetical protein
MDGAIAIALVSLAGTIFTAVWGWLTTRRRQEQDTRIAATDSAVQSLREANDELREELRRLAHDRDQARRDAEQTAEQVFGILADTINKNTRSVDALGAVIRESVAVSVENRRMMQEVMTAMTTRLTEIATGQAELVAGQETFRSEMRGHFAASATADAAIQERMDQVYERLAALMVKHDEDAQARARTILETIEALLPPTAAIVPPSAPG